MDFNSNEERRIHIPSDDKSYWKKIIKPRNVEWGFAEGRLFFYKVFMIIFSESWYLSRDLTKMCELQGYPFLLMKAGTIAWGFSPTIF